MRQCHVIGLVKYELQSLIKGNGHYAVMGVYSQSEVGKVAVAENKPLMLPYNTEKALPKECSNDNTSTISVLGESCYDGKSKQKRGGKGSNILLLIRKMMKLPETWKSIESKQDYQFLGSFSKPSPQQLYFISNCLTLEQSSVANPHFLWSDIQLSKGQLNKDRLIEMEIVDKNGLATKEKMFYRSAPCSGVKKCPELDCKYIAPIRERRPCPNHLDSKLVRSGDCPVEFVYIFPQEFHKDHRRWIGGIVRVEKHITSSLHNHPLHGSIKISQCVQDEIASAVISNPALTPTDIAAGKGLGFTPSAVDAASCHLGKVARKVNQVKKNSAISAKSWSPTNFEMCADELDKNDLQRSSDTVARKQKYLGLGRPYLVSTGMENGINYIFVMSPFMAHTAARADFIQTDITYDHMQGYKYLFHAVAFNHVTMEWMIVARVWMDQQSSRAYELGFKKVFEQCNMADQNFKVGETLQGIVTDWSDAEIKGLQNVVGRENALKLLKGCKVHWLRSCQRVSEFIAHSSNKHLECKVFMKIAAKIQTLPSAIEIIACFEALCGLRHLRLLIEKIPGICTEDETHYIDSKCDWSKAKKLGSVVVPQHSLEDALQSICKNGP